MQMLTSPVYARQGAAMLRAAAVPVSYGPGWWPNPDDTGSCRAWLSEVWSTSPQLAEGIRVASSSLAERVDAICAGEQVEGKQVRRAAASTCRYLLRATGRHTPFGLFAGVGPVSFRAAAHVGRRGRDQVMARADTQWLSAVVDDLESHRALLRRLDVVFTNLARQAGPRLETPRGPDTASVRFTSAVNTVRQAAESPIECESLSAKLSAAFPTADQDQVEGLLFDLVHQGFLITSLRAPLTITDPLTYVFDELTRVGAGELEPIAAVMGQLVAVQARLREHNQVATGSAEGARVRAGAVQLMRELSPAGRTPLAVDLRLDYEVHLPLDVAAEMEAAASVLARLSRHPHGEGAWRDFYTVFHERYGTATLVPLLDVVDPSTGIGYPAGYPGSVLPPPLPETSTRDAKLLALAWAAMAEGSREVVLDEASVREVSSTGAGSVPLRFPPHVEVAAAIHSPSVEALGRGDYSVVLAPARAVGTLTGRFAALAPGSGLEELFAAIPTLTRGALAVQLSFPPAYSHAENVARVPAYLPHILALGEHRAAGRGEDVIGVEDLALTATREGLHLVSLSLGCVLEPQAFHALALDKQPPPLARFLAHLSRGLLAAWHEFDWGPTAQELPYLPRVRHRRTVLSPARWRLLATDLPAHRAGTEPWAAGLQAWLDRWQCPSIVVLRDDDRTLPLDLSQRAHAAILRAHLARHGHAILTETVRTSVDLGWMEGHAHQVVLPLVSTAEPAPSPLTRQLPQLRSRAHGQLPGSPDARWVYAKLHTHPDRMDDIITAQVPGLLADLDDPQWWFIRYRSRHESDHLRVRIRTPDAQHSAHAVRAIGAWAQQLRVAGLAGRLSFDTYEPETGRYGTGLALDAAEEVFVADSRVVAAQLRHLPAAAIERAALTALNMAATVHGLLSDHPAAGAWLTGRPPTPATATAGSHGPAEQVVHLAHTNPPQRPLQGLPGWDGDVADAWQARAGALAHYRTHLGADADLDVVLESLLHMHHNRVFGIDRDGESTCRRLARQAALTWAARTGATP